MAIARGSMQTPDFLIVGGGIIGMLTALELRAGGAAVTLLERGEPGRESSWAGGGILSPLYPWRYPQAVTALASWSQARWPELAEELHAETGIDGEWTRSGLLVLEDEEQEAARIWARASGQVLRLVEGQEIAELEPALAKASEAGLWLPEVAQVRNPRLLRALRAALLARGVALEVGTEVTGFVEAAGRIRGVRTRAGLRAAENVVVCAGAWSGALLRPLGLEIEVAPVRGQMVLFRAPAGSLRRIVLRASRYLIPRRDGRILCGSTIEHAGFAKQTTAQAREELCAAAARLLPMLGGLVPEAHWAGLRPGSPNGVPFIGVDPRRPGLFVNSGHFRNGLVLAPASARLAADLLLGREPVLDPAPYALGAPRPPSKADAAPSTAPGA